MAAKFQKFKLFTHISSEITPFDALSLVFGLIFYIMYFTHTTVKIKVLKSKMADQNGRRTAKTKGIHKNYSIHHFLSTTLLQHVQELAKVE